MPTAASESRTQIFFMLLSAGIFAYFGFTTQWSYHSALDGRFLLFVALLDWTLKGAAIAFGLSAIVTLAAPLAGNALYAVSGLISALLLLVVAILDIADMQHTALSPVLLLIFAAWNGYGSWTGLQEVLERRSRG